MKQFNGLNLNLGNLAQLSQAKTRSISAENFTGEKGKGGMATRGTGQAAARDLGQGWKISPCITLPANETTSLANITGSGAIQHIWLTVDPKQWRRIIFRCYWDDEDLPSVEVPLGDFFCNGWCQPCSVNSLAIAVNPVGGFNSYWQMPFKKSARITVASSIRSAIPSLTCLTLWAIFMPRGDATIPCHTKQSTPLLMELRDRDITWALTWHGALIITAGGAKAKLNFIWTVIGNFPRSAEPAPRTTLAVPGDLSSPKVNTANSPLPIPECPK